MPQHRQPTPVRRRVRPAAVTAVALVLVCSVAGAALAAAAPTDNATASPTATWSVTAVPETAEPSATATVSEVEGAGATTSTTSTPSSAPASATGGAWLSGASGDGAADGSFGAWRGDPVDIVGTWADVGDNQTQLWSIAPGGEAADFTGALDIAPGGLLPGDTWAQAADGAYDDRWRQSLTTMAELRAGDGTTYVRPFHEFNLAGWDWSVTPADAADFVTAWKRYRALQQEVFPDAKLVYGVNVTSSGTDLDWRTTWPGAGQADVLGVDTYNGWPTITSAADFDAQLDATGDGGIPIGLDTYAAQAAGWGVPLAVPEWSGRAEMGDEPAYVTGMVDWFAAHAGTGPGQLAYEVLFNAPQDDGNFQLYADESRMPESAQAYVTAIQADADLGRADSAVSDAKSPVTRGQAADPSPAPSAAPQASPTSGSTAADPADDVDQADVNALITRVDALLELLEQA